MKDPRYHYMVSLTLTHPTMPSSRITDAMRLSPDHSGSVGEERRTPKDTPLQGFNKKSFWRYSFDVPRDDELEQFLVATLHSLEPSSSFLKELAACGGFARLFIGLFLEQENIGLELSPELQKRFGDLGISLGFDIYGPDLPAGAA